MAHEEAPGKLPPPPPTAGLFVRYVLGLGVSVGVGLAPYLGRINVPLFEPLLTIVPLSEQGFLIPLSTALMGLVAVGVQWYGGERPEWLRKWFGATLVIALLALGFLVYVHNNVVVSVQYLGTKSTSFLVGFSRPNKPPCPEGISDAECIRDYLTFNPAKIESFWGDKEVRNARLTLTLSYLVCMGSFSTLVGFIVIRTVGR